MDDPSETLRRSWARSWVAAGDDALRAAQMLRDQRNWRSSVSRSYYAAYSFLAAALTLAKVQFPGERVGPAHEPLPDLVRDNLGRRLGRRSVNELRTAVRRMYQARFSADYMPRASVRQEIADRSLRDARVTRKHLERELS